MNNLLLLGLYLFKLNRVNFKLILNRNQVDIESSSNMIIY